MVVFALRFRMCQFISRSFLEFWLPRQRFSIVGREISKSGAPQIPVLAGTGPSRKLVSRATYCRRSSSLTPNTTGAERIRPLPSRTPVEIGGANRNVVRSIGQSTVSLPTPLELAVQRATAFHHHAVPAEQLYLRYQRNSTGGRSFSQRPAAEAGRALWATWHASDMRGSPGVPRAQSSARPNAADRQCVLQVVSFRLHLSYFESRANAETGPATISTTTRRKLPASKHASTNASLPQPALRFRRHTLRTMTTGTSSTPSPSGGGPISKRLCIRTSRLTSPGPRNARSYISSSCPRQKC